MDSYFFSQQILDVLTFLIKGIENILIFSALLFLLIHACMNIRQQIDTTYRTWCSKYDENTYICPKTNCKNNGHINCWQNINVVWNHIVHKIIIIKLLQFNLYLRAVTIQEGVKKAQVGYLRCVHGVQRWKIDLFAKVWALKFNNILLTGSKNQF